jgi:hypothetical protein
MHHLLPRHALGGLIGTNDLEILAHEDMVRPVDADVVNLVLAVADFAALPAGCTITSVAVIAVLSVTPRTKTLSPAATALADAELVPVRYFVSDASLTVTFWPADVVTVKPDGDMPATVPDVPPAAGPDRALDPLPGPRPAAGPPLAADEPPPEIALTTPYEPPPIARTAAATMMDLVTLRLDIGELLPLVVTNSKAAGGRSR